MEYQHSALYAGTVLAYLLALIGVGAYKARKVKSQEDFSLAGRSMSTFVLVGTLVATWTGTGSIFGNAEETLKVGVPAFLIIIPEVLAIIVLYFLAAKIRHLGKFTIQDILEDRYGAAARVIGTITLLMAYVIIVSYQYRAGAAVVERILPGIGQTWAVVLVAIFVITYTALAGMYSVAYTDVVNGILMTAGIFIAIPIVYQMAGGADAVIGSLPAKQQSLFGHYSWGTFLSIFFPIFLLLLGDANMYQRFFSAKTPSAAKKSAVGMFIGVALVGVGIIALSLGCSALIAQGKLTQPENLGHLIVHAAFNGLPVILGSLLVATVVAVIVSTADSYLLAPSTSLVRDVYQRFLNPNAEDGQVVFMSRAIVVVLGIIGLGLAFTSDEFFYVALFAYTLYGAGITPALMAAFFWKGATPAGAVSSMLAGVITALVWKFGKIEFWEVDAVIPAIIINLVVLVVVSLATKKTDPELAA